MITNLSHVMTLANGIIGVSVLAMPFCFKQCGIVLGILILLLSSLLSKFACHLLVKSAVMSRRRNFEFLAFHAFGRTGKFLAELFIIGFLMGTCIAFFVVVGDLGPEIVGKMIGKNPEDIRTSLLIIIGAFIILPLGLLRNVDSLSSICTATIGFYLCLVLKVMTESLTHIFATDWYDKVFYWRPSGILQCLPIFSMALFCQTQLFEIYETIPNVSLEKMNHVVDVALNICTVVYVCVGFFGYVAFCSIPFTGNILMSLEPSLSSEAIKIGFVLSVAFSFPLVIFPCRASLNSLLFRWAHSYETASNYIPETRFRWLTFLIVVVSLITGILIPNIEFVLGLVGSTIGVMICLMFPAAFFISISSKNTNERILAQAMLFVGVWIMILGTYANLYAMEESANAKLTVSTKETLEQLNNIPLRLINEGDVQVLPPIPKIEEVHNLDDSKFNPPEVEKVLENTNPKDDVRQEPPIPVERSVVTEKTILESKKLDGHSNPPISPDIDKIAEGIKSLDKIAAEKTEEEKHGDKVEAVVKEEAIVLGAEEKIKEIEASDKKNSAMQKIDNLIHSDAIKKEDSELAADAELAEAEHDKKHEELRKTLEKHEIEQRQMLQEQKEIINAWKQQKQELEKEKKEKEASKKAVKKVDLHDRDTGNDETANSDKNPGPNSKEGSLKAPDESDKKDTKVKDPSLDETDKNETAIKSRGPILSALVKQIANSSNVNNVPMDVVRDIINPQELTGSNLETKQKIDPRVVNPKDEGAANLSNNNVQSLNNNDLPVPIALAIRETAKKDAEVTPPKKSEEAVAVGRDILETADRIKRDIDGILVNDDKKSGSVRVDDSKRDNVRSSFANDAAEAKPEEECSKIDGSLKDLNEEEKKKKTEEEINVEEKTTTELLLIKTNSYLLDQSNFGNANALDENFDLKRNFDNSNQRDLKPISSKNDNRK